MNVVWFLGNIPISHVSVDGWFEEQPHVGHWHENEFTSLRHVPPLLHGLLAHSSISGTVTELIFYDNYNDSENALFELFLLKSKINKTTYQFHNRCQCIHQGSCKGMTHPLLNMFLHFDKIQNHMDLKTSFWNLTHKSLDM